ncbi:MAG: hypothetical protein ACM3Q9_02485 [Methanosarcina sp.]
MSESAERVSLGGRVSEGEQHTLQRVRDISEEMAIELEAKFRAVREMAEPDSDARVNASATRLLALFETAEAELKEDGEISALTQKTARLELRTFARFVGEHAKRLAEASAKGTNDPEVREELDKRLENLGVLLDAIGGAIDGEGALLDRHEGGLRVFPIGNYTAEQLVHLITGEVILASADSLILREGEFRSLAGEIKKFTDEIEKGWPIIVRTVEGEDGPLNVRMTDFPVVELGALDASLEMLREGNAEEAMLNLMRARSRRAVRFGEADAAFAVVGGTSRNGLDQLPEADIQIDTDLLGSEPIDYWAMVTDTIEQFGEGREMFRGAVQSVEVSGRVASLTCEGATALTEHSSGGMIALGMNQFELISALMEQAGVQSEFRLSEEPEQPQPENFEVWTPLEGLTVAEPIEIAGITVVPPAQALARLDGLRVEQEGDTARSLSEEFRSGASYALTRVGSEMPNRAEDSGLARIDLALAWIATRGRYGAALLPDGEPQSFDRQAGRLTARRGRVVLVYGTKTERTWLRWPEEGDDVAERKLEAGSTFLQPELPGQIEIEDRLALGALRLAATARDPLVQVQALWQAIESYAAGIKTKAKLFSKSELKKLRQALPEDLASAQNAALERMVGRLNEEPLRVRLRRRLKSDAVPITDAELKVLDDLREVRNAVAHGRDVEETIDRDTVNYGISIVARILVHRIAASAKELEKET